MGLDKFNDYLKESKPDVMGIVETKLKGQVLPDSIGNGIYKVWYRNRQGKQGGGVMLLIKEKLSQKVTYGDNNADTIALKIENNDMTTRDFVLTYVPPKTRSWGEREYTGMISNTKNSFKKY